ncbi:uncharacterized protein LOC123196518 [Mangifera indica]|uniref:uncharacterized protein LOC123196518 n=1 Tax=Mangifera indica TaxID=29780 RepID=UPI001CFB768C|nr:uncharacterized protein LOC123196518 [Mangifera indica]
MTLSCLTCRTDSEGNLSHYDHQPSKKIFRVNVERKWSGKLASAPCEQIREPVTPLSMELVSSEKLKKIRRPKVVTFEDNSPRLVRSPGMRRDWSFEDFRKRNAFRIKTTPTQDEEIDY